ncbi:hypothetical protein [Devosia sediminis]|uniref:Uncharacterized protein n=1 Tax=Devosia sediminis TaxID=2798801 RepID=A0A934IU89_9HYPH|nr:hypothetical protein [Devosia sediminis]MBJ3786848.1 hypothetical protein [Devosia sediminis]
MHPLKDARTRNLGWVDVARHTKILLSSEPGSGQPVGIRAAETLSGYSTNQLRRMLAGLAFLDALQATDPALATWLGEPGFSTAEMLSKLWRQDQDGTVAYLRTEPKLNYASLYARHKEQTSRRASPSQGGKRSSQKFQNQWLEWVRQQPESFAPLGLGNYSIIRPGTAHAYCKPSVISKFIPLGPERQAKWIGIDFIDDPVWRPDTTWRRMMVLATEATFLDLVLLVVAVDRGVIGEKAAHWQIDRMVRDLGITNLEVVPVEGMRLHPIGEIKADAPTPDRRGGWSPPRLWRDILEIGANDEI